MILTLLTLSVSVMAFSLFLAHNPLTIGLMILMMALLLAMTFAYSMSSWMAFLIFLIYIGGMLVMFSYFVSMIPNQTLSIAYNITAMLLSLLIMIITSSLLNMQPTIISSQPLLLNTMYLSFNTPILILLASILLFTMVVVVKLTILSKGPLRPFSFYV